MAVTPYIWLMWQNKTGRYILYVCILIVYCVLIYTFIQDYGWWCLPAAIIFAIALYADIKWEKKQKEKEKKRLREEFDRLHAMADNLERQRRNRVK